MCGCRFKKGFPETPGTPLKPPLIYILCRILFDLILSSASGHAISNAGRGAKQHTYIQ